MELKAKTNFTPAEKVAPVVIEQVILEKPGGGIVVTDDKPILQGTAVYAAENGKFKPIKGYQLVKSVDADDTTIQIAKGSNVAPNDFIGYGKKSVKATAVDTSNADYDVVTVTIGVEIPKGTVLYEAGSASASSATPKATPVYVIGNDIPANSGECPVRLINGANLRKETAPVAPEVAALIPTINLV